MLMFLLFFKLCAYLHLDAIYVLLKVCLTFYAMYSMRKWNTLLVNQQHSEFMNLKYFSKTDAIQNKEFVK